MNQTLLSAGFVTLLFVAGFFAIEYYDVHYHENAHSVIARYHGCNSDKQEYNYFLFSGNTTCTNHQNVSNDWRLQEEYLHSLNEIQGYSMNVQNIAILITGYLISIAFVVGRTER